MLDIDKNRLVLYPLYTKDLWSDEGEGGTL